MKSANPNFFQRFIEQKWLRYLFIFAAIAMIAIAMVRILTPPQIEITPSPQLTTSTIDQPIHFSNITFSGEKISIPKTLSVYSLQQTTNTDSIVLALSDKFGLVQNQYLDTVWNSDNYSLSYLESIQQYTINKNASPVEYENLPPTIDTQKALQESNDYIQNILPEYSQLSPVDKAITYFEGGSHLEVTTPNKANWMLIPFTLELEGFPVYNQNSGSFPLEVLINSEYEITKVTFTAAPLRYVSLQKNNVISIGKAVENINQQQGTVISVFNQDTQTLSLEDITKGNLTSVFLEYRVDQANQLIYPYYRFFGSIENNQGSVFETEIITPAIATTL